MKEVELTFEVESDLYTEFCAVCDKLGITPEDAVRGFIQAFVEAKGFPFPVTDEELEACKRAYNAHGSK